MKTMCLKGIEIMKLCVLKVISIVVVLLAFTAIVGFGSIARAETKKEYVFGVRADSSNSAGQVKEIMERALKVFNRESGIIVKLKFYIDDETFMNDLKAKKLDLMYSWRVDQNVTAIRRYGYLPLITFNVYGLKDERLCIYTKKDSPVNGIEDIKGAKILLCGAKNDYYRFRQLVKGNPDKYFKVVRFQKNIPACGSFFYSLSLDETEFIFASDLNEEIHKLNNPGPVKNVKKVACSSAFPLFFLNYSKNVPKKDLDTIRETLMNSPKEPEFKDFLPLMRTTKFKFAPVSIEDYRRQLDMFAEAEKKGWDKELERYVKMQSD